MLEINVKQKIMIAAGAQCFEFEGEIIELEDDYIVLRAKHGDIYIERKYLVFIQYLNEEKETVQQEVATPKSDAAAKFISERLNHLRYDPVKERLEEKFFPPSQLPDDDDEEVTRNIYGAAHLETPITRSSNLKDAVKTAMQNVDTDFSMGASGGKYQNPAQTILGIKNASHKKS